MRCPKCGSEVSAGAKFCRNCGARLAPEPGPARPAQPVQTAPAEPAAAAAPAVQTRPGGKKPVAAIAAVLVVLAVAAAAWLLLGSGRKSGIDCFVDYSGYYTVMDMKKDQGFQLTPVGRGSGEVVFGPDESYLFLFEGEGNLCRVNCDQVELDPEASNIQAVELVDTGVSQNDVTPLTGGRAVYLREGGELCWFDGETVNRLAGDVVTYSLLDSEKLLYLVETLEGYQVYMVPLDGSEEAAALTGASEMAWLWSPAEAGESALYSVTNENGWETVYLVGADGEPQMLDDAAEFYGGNMEDVFYYTADTTRPYEDSFSHVGTLFQVKDGTATQLAERVNNFWLNGDQLIYLVEDDLNQERAAEYFSFSDVRMDPVCYHRCYVMAEGLDTVEVDMDDLVEAMIQDGEDQPWIEEMMTNGTEVFVRASEQALYEGHVRDGVASGFIRVGSSPWMAVADDVLYYASEMPGGAYGLSSVRDGKIVSLSENVDPGQIWIYADGTVLAMQDMTYSDGSFDSRGRLVMLDAEGGETVLGEAVTGFLRMDGETVLFLSGDTLCRFQDGEAEELGAPVEDVWCRNPRKPVCACDVNGMELS